MPLSIQYALAQSNDIDEVCREISDMYMQETEQLKKYEFDISKENLDMNMEDIVVRLAERNIEKLRTNKLGTKKIGYFRIDNLEDKIEVNERDINRKWEERFIVINKNTGEKEVVKDSRDVAIKYAKYKAEETGNNYEIHIEKYDRYNTSLEAEVGPSVEDENEDKLFVLFWFIDSENTGMGFFDGDYGGLDSLY